MPTDTHSDGPPVALSRKQAAAAMGVSQWTIDKWVRAGRLRSVKIGGNVLIPRVALEEMIAAAMEDGQ